MFKRVRLLERKYSLKHLGDLTPKRAKHSMDRPCLWVGCSEAFENVAYLRFVLLTQRGPHALIFMSRAHLRRHTSLQKTCQWGSCSKVMAASLLLT
jgi:hypothetical protein